MDLPLLLWLTFFTILSFIFCAIHIKYLLQLWKHRHIQYITTRKPKLLWIYSILTLCILLLIIPNMCISAYVNKTAPNYQTKTYYFFATDCIYASIFCALINTIAIRAWLLLFDHKFAMATVDRNWRNIISPNESNFFLKNKNTFGNVNFLLKLVFSVYIGLILIILVLTNSMHFQSIDTFEEYLFISLRLCIGIPVSIFSFIIIHKTKSINDEFRIRDEIQYLSHLLYYILFTSTIVSILLLIFSKVYPIYVFESVLYVFDVIFICCSSYIQTGWVLKSLLDHLRKLQKRRISMQANSTLKKKIPMVSVLRNQHAFEAFMRHCVNELSVESVLFLVEVAQYKASLCSYDAPDRISQFCSINVQESNLRQLLIDSRQQRNTPTLTPYQMELSMNLGQMNIPKNDQNFKDFQYSILQRDWMPIAWHLRPFIESFSIVHTPTDDPHNPSKTQRDLRMSIKSANTTMELVLQNTASVAESDIDNHFGLNVNVHSNSPTAPMPGHDRQTPKTPKTCAVSSEWIADFGVFIFDKYIQNNSDLCVNVSSATRKFLMHIFEMDSHQSLCDFIVSHSGGNMDRSEQCTAAIDQRLLINTYLYHVFDAAFEEIWKMTRANSFLRFTFTDSYKKCMHIL